MSGARNRNPVFKTLLQGLYDEDCPLYLLRGCPHIMKKIWLDLQDYWTSMITLPDPEDNSSDQLDDKAQPFFLTRITFEGNAFGGNGYSFPQPDPSLPVNINMMPFIVGETFSECRLPEYIRPYWSLISACLAPERDRAAWHMWPRDKIPSQLGRVFYLTVQESFVEADTAQRRPGLHVDCPGSVRIKNEVLDSSFEGKGRSETFQGHRWGLGCTHYVGKPESGEEDEWGWLEHVMSNSYVLQGGIYLASSLPASCRAWDCRVDPAAVHRLGDVEHLRGGMPGSGLEMEAGQLYWITDRTPHESVPLKQAAFRQFFRLVTSQVSLWYSDHSTPNPLGVKPDPTLTKIVKGDKFSEEGVEIVEVSTDNTGDKMETEHT